MTTNVTVWLFLFFGAIVVPVCYLLVTWFRGRYTRAMAWGGGIKIGLSSLALFGTRLVYGPDVEIEFLWVTYSVWVLVNAGALGYYVCVLLFSVLSLGHGREQS